MRYRYMETTYNYRNKSIGTLSNAFLYLKRIYEQLMNIKTTVTIDKFDLPTMINGKEG